MSGIFDSSGSTSTGIEGKDTLQQNKKTHKWKKEKKKEKNNQLLILFV